MFFPAAILVDGSFLKWPECPGGQGAPIHFRACVVLKKAQNAPVAAKPNRPGFPSLSPGSEISPSVFPGLSFMYFEVFYIELRITYLYEINRAYMPTHVHKTMVNPTPSNITFCTCVGNFRPQHLDGFINFPNAICCAR